MGFFSKVKSAAVVTTKIGVSVACPPVGAAIIAKDTYSAVKKASDSKTVSGAVATIAAATIIGS